MGVALFGKDDATTLTPPPPGRKARDLFRGGGLQARNLERGAVPESVWDQGLSRRSSRGALEEEPLQRRRARGLSPQCPFQAEPQALGLRANLKDTGTNRENRQLGNSF